MLTEKIYNIIDPIIEKNMMMIKSNVIDYAILGSSSGHYGWKEVRFCDFDIWIYCNNIEDVTIISGIRKLIQDISEIMKNKNIVVLADAINGPYKPEIWEVKSKDILFLHLLIDDENTYNRRSIFTKLSWSKYEARYNKNLLKELLDRLPTESDLLYSKCGILKTLKTLQAGVVMYNKMNLFTGEESQLEFNRESAQYIEFILHSVMTIARNRARLLHQTEADCLENMHFAEWYDKMYGSNFVKTIAEYKMKVSECGYGVIKSNTILENRAIDWLIDLKDEVEKNMKKNNWIVPIVSYILAGFSFFFGSYEPFWDVLDLDATLRIPLTVGISILILLIGHFINTLQVEEKLHSDVNELKIHLNQLPNLNSLRILPNGDEGINYLSMRIKEARFIRNTRIPVGTSVLYNTTYARKYIIETKKILRNKDVIFKDVIVKENINLANEFIQISKNYHSKYQYKELENYNKGFLNFMIIEDKFNISEVIFGWPTSETQGYREKCFISQDRDLISLFATIFEELWNA